MSIDPFAPTTSAPSTPATAPTAEQPAFGTDSPWDDNNLGEGFDIPALPVGVLTSEITAVRMNKGNCIVDVKCTDPAYNGVTAGIFLGKDMQMLGQIAASLGLVSKQQRVGNQWKTFFRDSAGNKGADAFAGKPCLLLWDPYNGAAGVARFGLMAEAKRSPEMVQYLAEACFNDEQIAVLSKARGGVIPCEKQPLFSDHG